MIHVGKKIRSTIERLVSNNTGKKAMLLLV